MTRNEIIARIKELGIQTEKPAQQCKTEYLQSLLETEPTEETKRRGRKVNPMSARQLRLAVQMTGVRGRRPNPDSARQVRLAARAEKEANGLVVKRGRPKLTVA